MTTSTPRVALLCLAVVAAGPACAARDAGPPSARTPGQVVPSSGQAVPSTRQVVPSPGQVDDRGGYVRRACPDDEPARGTTPFEVGETDISGRPGAGAFTRRRAVGAGTLDVRDGRLWLTGWEYLPYEPGPYGAVDVPRGDLPVSLVEVSAGTDWVAAAVAVRLRDATPVRWAETRGGPATDAGTIAIASYAAAARLSRVRTDEKIDGEFTSGGGFWLTPCQTYAVARTGPNDAITVSTGGDGGFPMAVGYDAEGRQTDLLVSVTNVPWSLLGVPGTPPPRAVSAEPMR